MRPGKASSLRDFAPMVRTAPLLIEPTRAAFVRTLPSKVMPTIPFCLKHCNVCHAPSATFAGLA
jgi:hypothetical protein